MGVKARIGKPKIGMIERQHAPRCEMSIKIEDEALELFEGDELRTIVRAQLGQLTAL